MHIFIAHPFPSHNNVSQRLWAILCPVSALCMWKERCAQFFEGKRDSVHSITHTARASVSGYLMQHWAKHSLTLGLQDSTHFSVGADDRAVWIES